MFNSQKDKDVFLDAILYACLYYILSHPKTFKTTHSIFPKISDRNMLHAMVFLILVFGIQKYTKRV